MLRRCRARSRQRRDFERRSHRQGIRNHTAASPCRIESQTPAPRRRRQGQEFFSRGIAQARRRRRAHPEKQKYPQLCLCSPCRRHRCGICGVSAKLSANDAVRAIVEGAFIGNFDPGYYKSDRKDKDRDQKIDAVTIVVPSNVPATARRCKGSGKRPASRTHRRRVAELHSRPGQRTLQPHDAHHNGRARQEDGGGSRPEVRDSTAPTRSKN